ncbi:MAG: AIR synthase-related protein [Synergistaceae bacterium]|mgnify:CR=1 FL=1|jgi:hydrogenase maturation factor|nr:AIR synthase-related protein [Synergistaceae bacterium]MDD3917062.1 AIR synthase-related protein [Synergistaceae bacterium]NLD95814.1 hydrogenase expression protein [Synergistaceae bacterium]HOO86459.1 AIR synthase-related protein [Synergistales bacterium]HRV97466.1 AIR synthase-related protein [Aminobacteriaceae bacterium]
MEQQLVGKLPPSLLEGSVFRFCGAPRPEVIIGPGIGEDAALLQLPEGKFLAVASDPIVGAREGAGKFLVHINANDIACKGGDPSFFVATLLVPSADGVPMVQALMREIHEACLSIGAAVIGGHTELTSRYDQPVLVGTMMGPTAFVHRATDIRPGDVLILTKHAGLEGMAILANDRPDLLLPAIGPEGVEEARGWLEQISVLEEAKLLRGMARFLHDPTEGGVGGGIAEIVRLSGLGVELDYGSVPFSPLTKKAVQTLDFDPLHLISSGVLLAVVPQGGEADALAALREKGISGVAAGHFVEGAGNCPDDVREELWGLLERPKERRE